MDALKLWANILTIIKESQGDQIWESWFRPIKARSLSENTLTLEVPNKFFQSWIKDHYLGTIQEALKSTAPGTEIAVELLISKEQQGGQKEKTLSSVPAFSYPVSSVNLLARSHLELNPRFTFENFVVGPSNRFAHAASSAVAESPARAYNPLFIYGGVGLGKTHLMQAIGAQIFKNNPQFKVTYISSEKFTNELISAIQHRTTREFRERYRHVDILLIDDIHFIAGKESTQEEFFHTFNTLYDAHKQIVLSSDRSPKDIPALEERLVSRFEWGLVTDIQPPDLETRTAILKKKIEQNSAQVPEDVVFFIADKIKLNIRELEGALIRVVAYTTLTNEIITLETARAILKDMLLEERKISIDIIQKKVAEYFNIRILDLKAKKRNRVVVFPRQIAMYLARSHTEFSLPEIGEYFGGRDHTTVLHACEKIRTDLKKDPNLKELLDKLVLEMKGG